MPFQLAQKKDKAFINSRVGSLLGKFYSNRNLYTYIPGPAIISGINKFVGYNNTL